MNEAANAPANQYCGWMREMPHGKWRIVCRAGTESDCWRMLIAIRALTDACEKMVLREGKRP